MAAEQTLNLDSFHAASAAVEAAEWTSEQSVFVGPAEFFDPESLGV